MGAFGPQLGLEKDIRAGLTFFSLPLLGTKALAVSEYVAMDARRREEPSLTHIDWVVGSDRAGSTVARWYDALAAFALDATPQGGVVVPIR
jgi:hypothetical protein